MNEDYPTIPKGRHLLARVVKEGIYYPELPIPEKEPVIERKFYTLRMDRTAFELDKQIAQLRSQVDGLKSTVNEHLERSKKKRQRFNVYE